MPRGKGVLLVEARAMMSTCGALDDNLRSEKNEKMLVLRTHSTQTATNNPRCTQVSVSRFHFIHGKILSEKKTEELIVGYHW